jgi:uncharacterized phage protein gp47/JayE
MMEDAYEYHLVSTDERFLDYINNREDIENMYCLFLSVYAFENNNIYEDMTLIYNSNDLEKARGKDLDILGNKFGIPRPQARRSSVQLTFYLENPLDYDYTIPQGTIVSTNNGATYYTVEEGIIIRGQKRTYVEAYSSNAGYNSRVDRRTLRNCNLGGNVFVTNVKGSSGGRSAYSDEEYRRLIRNWAYSHIKGTKEAYELFFAYYEGVDGYRLIPLWDGPGTAKVVVDPSDDFILNDITVKLRQNVHLLDDDVVVVGAIKRRIDINVNVNVDIDNILYYSIGEREIIAEKVANAIELYIDGGYRRTGVYYPGLSIGENFIPFRCGMFVAQEVPEIRSIDFQDTIKNIDNIVYAHDFSNYNHEDSSYDQSSKKLIAASGNKYTSPMLYISDGKKFISDSNGFKISFIKDGVEVYSTTKSTFSLDGLDLYGAYIQIEALDDGANLSQITLTQSISNNLSKNYNTNVHISEDEIAICGNIEVIIQDDTGSDESNIVCY